MGYLYSTVVTCDPPLRVIHAALRIEYMHVAEVDAR